MPFAPLSALLFAFYVPGRAIVSNWPSMAARSQVAAPVLFSLTVLTLLATLTLWAGYWHPLGLLIVEAVASGIGLFTAILRRRRAGRPRVAIPAAAPTAAELHDLDG